jgi:hypothetical protein
MCDIFYRQKHCCKCKKTWFDNYGPKHCMTCCKMYDIDFNNKQTDKQHCCNCKVEYSPYQTHCCHCKGIYPEYIRSVLGPDGYDLDLASHCCNCKKIYNPKIIIHCYSCHLEYKKATIHCCECKVVYPKMYNSHCCECKRSYDNKTKKHCKLCHNNINITHSHDCRVIATPNITSLFENNIEVLTKDELKSMDTLDIPPDESL